MSDSRDELAAPERPGAEPLFNAPAVSLGVIGLLAIAYGVQVYLLSPETVSGLALSAPALAAGHWWTLLSHIFLHANLVHILMNAGAALAFGPAVARQFGPGVRAGGTFLLFFLLCGVAGGLGYVALHPQGTEQVVGASGAISGLWGGAARLLGRRRGLWGLWEGPVRGQVVAVIVLNLLSAQTAFATDGQNIAWEAHIAGFLAGLLLIGPFARLARARDHGERLFPEPFEGACRHRYIKREELPLLVSQILKDKGDLVFTAGPGETVGAVAALLHSRRVGAMVVVDGDAVVGIVSERDIVRMVAEEGSGGLARPIHVCMTRDVVFATPAETVDSLLGRMTDRRIRHLPVMRDGRLVGIISIGDLVKHKIEEVEAEADGLKAYITAG